MENTIDNVLVIKVGTNTLIENNNGVRSLDYASFARIGKQVVELVDDGYGVVLVSSGAITAGIVEAGTERSEDIEMVELQRFAGIGWQYVLEAWRHNLARRTTAGMLLTRHELDEGENTRKEALATAHCHMRHGDVLVVNENDSIAHEEIKFGDNDMLAGILAVQLAKTALYNSVSLVLLTDKNGLYQDKDDENTVIRTVDDIATVEACAGDTENISSTGGMTTKLVAAKLAKIAGVETIIANGRTEHAIKQALWGEIGTRFRVSGQK